MKLSISSGNNKIGKVVNISLPPGVTCPKNVPCLKQNCYALKFYKMRTNVKTAWNNNWNYYKRFPKKYFDEIQMYIDKKRVRPKYFRWHVGGDIPSQDYLNGMKIMANYNPDITFLAYTKNFSLNFKKIPKNLKIIISSWPGFSVPKELSENFPVSYLVDKNNPDKRVSLLDKKSQLICSSDCVKCDHACWNLEEKNINTIIFKKH